MPAKALWQLLVHSVQILSALQYVSFAFCQSTGKLSKYEKLALGWDCSFYGI